jgi:hypothetical protein
MKTTAVCIAAVLLLAGCTAAPSGVAPLAARSGDDTSSSSEPAEVVETPEPTETPWPYEVVADGEAIFLNAMRNEGSFGLSHLSDDEFLALGRAACRQLAQGVLSNDVEVVAADYPDEPSPRFNDRAIGAIASETLCFEFDHFKNDR